MTNKIFSKVSILLAATVLISTALQAQSWLGSKVLTVHNSLQTNTYAQKVRPYGENFLIALSKSPMSIIIVLKHGKTVKLL